ARTYRGDAAARHLLRVASGLESFVLGEAEIAGQVRVAARVSRAAGTGDVELERLMDAAISASRKRQRRTSILAPPPPVAGGALARGERQGGQAPRGGGAGQGRRGVGAGGGGAPGRRSCMYPTPPACGPVRRRRCRGGRPLRPRPLPGDK